MSNLQIRAAEVRDLETLREYERGVVDAERPFNQSISPGPATYYDLEALIADPQSELLIADIDGTIAATGYATIKRSLPYLEHDRHAYLGFMFVLPDFRGQGLIQKILDALVEWSASHGVVDYYLDVYANNAAAVKAYTKYGFEPNMIEMKING